MKRREGPIGGPYDVVRRESSGLEQQRKLVMTYYDHYLLGYQGVGR